MTTTTNPNSVLYQLRRLTPERPLLPWEALRIAELQANRLLAHAGVTEPATPDSIVAGLPFIEVVLRRDLPVSGLTNWFKPRWLILLSGTEPSVRRRFSLMHEFKHVIDHEAIAYLYPDHYGIDSLKRAELAADYFAACVLMPKKLVKRRFFQGLSDPSELAAEFGVSEVAMRYRLQQLGLIDRSERGASAYRATDGIKGYMRTARRRETPVAA